METTVPLTVSCEPGATRGAVLNTGAKAAKGDVLLFLWPGTQLPENALHVIERNFQLLPQTIGGNFHLEFADNSWWARLLTYDLKRLRYEGRYFGNSGLFVRKKIFEALGGFRDYDFLEDYDFVRRMEKYGATLYIPETVIASTHKVRHRKFSAVLIWLIALSLYPLDISPNKLAGLYHN